MSKKNREERKQLYTRIVCLALAGLMIGSVVLGAVLSQVF